MMKKSPTEKFKAKSFDVIEQLNVMATIIETYGSQCDFTALLRREAESNYIDDNPLASDFECNLNRGIIFEGLGRVFRMDVVLDELKFSGHRDEAIELKDRISNLVAQIRQWENKWRVVIRKHGRNVNDKLHSSPGWRPEAGDYLGRLTQNFNQSMEVELAEINGAADDTARCIRQFVRILNATHSQTKEKVAETVVDNTDTQKKLSVIKRTRDQMTKNLLIARWDGQEAGKTEADIFAEFKKMYRTKLGKNDAEREQSFENIARNVRRRLEVYDKMT